jgi:hypothetical protein
MLCSLARLQPRAAAVRLTTRWEIPESPQFLFKLLAGRGQKEERIFT